MVSKELGDAKAAFHRGEVGHALHELADAAKYEAQHLKHNMAAGGGTGGASSAGGDHAYPAIEGKGPGFASATAPFSGGAATSGIAGTQPLTGGTGAFGASSV
jgi:hypothetical protein